MKVYYAAINGQRSNDLDTFVTQKIPNIIQELGNDVSLYLYNSRTANSDISFMEMADRIQSSDVFVGEMSSPSQTLGFQVAYALSVGKPVLYIYNELRNGKPDTSIAEHPSRLLRMSTYLGENDLRKILSSFFNYSQKQMNSTRTSFMSTHKIDIYVTNSARKIGTSKAEIIRQLLNDGIDRDILSIM